jgi:hypothetical protein
VKSRATIADARDDSNPLRHKLAFATLAFEGASPRFHLADKRPTRGCGVPSFRADYRQPFRSAIMEDWTVIHPALVDR